MLCPLSARVFLRCISRVCAFPVYVVLVLGAASLSVTAYAQQPAGGRGVTQATAQRNVAAPLNGQARQQQPAIGQPEWFPLSPEHEKYLDDILRFWEFEAAKVERYRCKFIRWEYEPTVLPNDPRTAVTISQGKIQYAAPDKGLFHVEEQWDVVREQRGNSTYAVMKKGEDGKLKAEYAGRKKEEIIGDHWVCDGKSIYEFKPKASPPQIIQREIPPNMQGSRITEGPLPFLFGAKAVTIKERYWIRPVIPAPKEGRFCLEAVPKRRDDAADFMAIVIYIDEKEFLPEAISLFNLGGSSATFEFQNREKNWNLLTEKLKNPFLEQFYAPQTPFGWKLVKEPFKGAPAAAPSLPTAKLPFMPFGPRQAAQGSSMPQRR